MASVALKRVSAMVFAFVILACAQAARAASDVTSAQTQEVDSWQAEFRALYDGDACAKSDSFDAYWKWVRRFFLNKYEYNSVEQPSWIVVVAEAEAKAHDAAARSRLREKLIKLGKRVSADWAKPNSCRKIRTESNLLYDFTEPGKPSLTDFAPVVIDAVEHGDEKAIEAAVDKVAALVERALH